MKKILSLFLLILIAVTFTTSCGKKNEKAKLKLYNWGDYLTPSVIKKFEKEVKTGNKETASNNLNIAIQRVDKAMSSGKIHKNKAARLKSRMTKMMNTME